MDDAHLDDLTAALAREHRHLTEALAWARKHGITGEQAQRFVQRQRAACKRRRFYPDAGLVPYDPQHRTNSLLWCCDRWHPIHQIPLTVLCCGTTYLVEDHRRA